MVKKIILVAIAILVLFFCARWVFQKDARWEPITAMVGSLLTVITGIWGIVEKQKANAAAKQQSTPKPDNTNLQRKHVLGLQYSQMPLATVTEKDELPARIKLLQQKLLTAPSVQELRAMKYEVDQLMKTSDRPELAQLKNSIANAIRYEDTLVQKEWNYYSQGKQIASQYSVPGSAGQEGGSSGWLSILLIILVFAGLGFVLYRIGRYFIVNW